MKTQDGRAPKVRKAILFVNPAKKQARALALEIADELSSLDIKSDTLAVGGKSPLVPESGYDIAVSLGGDGTVLAAARAVSPKNIPIFPVNLGTFGFIAGVRPFEWRKLFREWLDGAVPLSRRVMLDVMIKRGGAEIPLGCCLNDAVISGTGKAKIINLRVSRGETLELGEYHSDGLIVSTPTGSTAYSAAAGGPFVDPELELVILNPICPFTLSQRPLVFPANEEIIIEVDKGQRGGVLLTIDGQIGEKLKKGDRIHIKKAANYCFLVASGRQVFFEALKTKLIWAGGKAEGMK